MNPKKVAETNLEVWAGPWKWAKAMKPDLYVSIGGGALEVDVEDRGLGLPIASPKGVAIHTWPPYSNPPLGADFWAALAARLRGERGRLYIGCSDGLRATSVALAILGYHLGLTDSPVAWVREVYHPLSVFTDTDAEYVAQATGVSEGLGGVCVAGVAKIVDVAPPPREELKSRPAAIRHIVRAVAEEEGAEGLMDYLEFDDGGEAVYVQGLVGTLEIEPPDESGTLTARLWHARGATSARSNTLFHNAVLREFIRREWAVAKFLEETGIPPEDARLTSYDDIFGLEVNERGVFIGPDGEEMTPCEAADYVYTTMWGRDEDEEE